MGEGPISQFPSLESKTSLLLSGEAVQGEDACWGVGTPQREAPAVGWELRLPCF